MLDERCAEERKSETDECTHKQGIVIISHVANPSEKDRAEDRCGKREEIVVSREAPDLVVRCELDDHGERVDIDACPADARARQEHDGDDLLDHCR